MYSKIKFQGLYDLIREAQKRREMKKAEEKIGEKPNMPKSEDIVTKQDSTKRPESH